MSKSAKSFLLPGIVILALFLYSCRSHKENYVIMLSMDGFRWDYPQLYETPNLDRLEKKGVKAKSLIPSFPTKTFPNHFTMVTGLYPDHHGIVANSFYDPEMDAYYAIRDRESVRNPDFYQGEPIWVTAEKQGVISASYFWVGSEANIDNTLPSYWKEYNHDFPFSQRLDTIIAWLNLPVEKRPRLITWYMDEPDSHGHDTGPYEAELGSTIFYLDSLVGIFLKKINQLPIRKRINVIITSDHGMGETSSERWINLSDYVSMDWFSAIGGGNPLHLLTANEGYYDSAYSALSQIPHLQAWKSEEVPERLHYGKNIRTGDFVIVADSSYSLSWREVRREFTGGSHGYDNRNSDMHAIFYATGPDFRKGKVFPSFENIHIYPMICRVLALQPAEIDGNLDQVIGMLR